MNSVIFYQKGLNITNATINYDGSVFISEQEFAGDYLLRILKEEKPALVLALSKALHKSDAENLEINTDNTLLSYLKLMFTNTEASTYLDIKKFLKHQGIMFKSEYWPSR